MNNRNLLMPVRYARVGIRLIFDLRCKVSSFKIYFEFDNAQDRLSNPLGIANASAKPKIINFNSVTDGCTRPLCNI